MKKFLQEFMFGGLVAVGIGTPVANHYYALPDEIQINGNEDVFFGPAMRKTQGNLKSDVLGTKVLWVDVDDEKVPNSTLPPSIKVFSGHGWHLYWILDTPLLDIDIIERLNKILEADVPTSDIGCWNCNRVLRIPETINAKDPSYPVDVRLAHFSPAITYTSQDIEVLEHLSKKHKHKIYTGDSRGYRSRSERDWAIVTALINAGATDELIQTIFDHQKCGGKHLENPKYLPHTLEIVRAKSPIASDEPIIEKEDGYYVPFRKSIRRISTFTIAPKVLLDGSAFEMPDAIVGDVAASGYTWPDVTFTREAFTTVGRMDRQTPVAAWQFLGRDGDVRLLLPYLLDRLQSQGLPKVAATPILGLHKISNQWLFLGDKHTLSADDLWEGYKGPLCWLPTRREHPKMHLMGEPTETEMDYLAENIPKLNEPGTIWPMIGWYAASCLKPWLETQGYRFPVLNVTGTKGSGKTTLIQRVFMPLFGQTEPKSYDSGTTRFVTLALLGSTNAIPIAFSEFRYGLVEQFIRFILLAYDTGHDPRGRSDQTTVDYPLSAPFSIDGEDLVEDPAARERIVVAHLHPSTVDEQSEAYNVYNDVRDNLPASFGRGFIQSTLGMLPQMPQQLADARTEMFRAFPGKMPDRVRNNHTVTYLGMTLWCNMFGITPPGAEVLRKSITSVFDIEAGRARTLADAMTEDLVNAVAGGTISFRHKYNSEANILWFQLAPAHTWWIAHRRRQGRGALERDAIRSQLKEAPYLVTPQVVDDAWMFGIDIEKAADIGLDIPMRISDQAFVMRF